MLMAGDSYRLSSRVKSERADYRCRIAYELSASHYGALPGISVDAGKIRSRASPGRGRLYFSSLVDAVGMRNPHNR